MMIWVNFLLCSFGSISPKKKRFISYFRIEIAIVVFYRSRHQLYTDELKNFIQLHCAVLTCDNVTWCIQQIDNYRFWYFIAQHISIYFPNLKKKKIERNRRKFASILLYKNAHCWIGSLLIEERMFRNEAL